MRHILRLIRTVTGDRLLRVLDVGSMVAQPGQRSFREVCAALPSVTYTGLDLVAGANVDVVSKEPYKFPVPDASFDVVISGSVFEHIEYPWLTIREVARVLKPGGLAVIIAPSSGVEHRYPQDCWRFYPDGMRALAKWAGLQCLDVVTGWHETRIFMFGDTVGLLHKEGAGPPPAIKIGDVRTHAGTSSQARARYLDAGAWLLRLYKKIGRRLFRDIY